MPRLNFLRTMLLLSASLFLCGVTAKPDVGLAKTLSRKPSSSPAQSRCRSTTDAEIVAAIHEKIKADTRFDDQWKHINVSSRNRVVTLSGWVKGRVQVRDLGKFASTTACVRRVINRLKPRRKVGCGPGQARCGDICISASEDCNIIQ